MQTVNAAKRKILLPRKPGEYQIGGYTITVAKTVVLDPYCSLLCPFDENIFDVKDNYLTTAVGGAAIVTNEKKYGDGSLYLASGKSLTVSGTSTVIPAADEFSIEMWCRIATGGSGAMSLLTNRSGDGSSTIKFSYFLDASTRKLVYDIWATDNSQIDGDETSTTFSYDTWFHTYLGRLGNKFYLAINGAVSEFTGNTKSINTSGTWYLGLSPGGFGGGGAQYTGHIDDLRISSKCRYTNNFTPPAKGFSIYL